MKKVVQTVKGTRDFYPEQMAIRVWLYNTMRQVAESFGYQEYEAPILEPLEPYKDKFAVFSNLSHLQADTFGDGTGTQGVFEVGSPHGGGSPGCAVAGALS